MPISDLVRFKTELEPFTCPKVDVFESEVNHFLIATECLVLNGTVVNTNPNKD